MTRVAPLLAAACASVSMTMSMSAPGAAAAERGDTSFVVTYLCEGERHLVVGYPAYRDAARAPGGRNSNLDARQEQFTRLGHSR